LVRANATAGLIRRCGEAERRVKAERIAKIYSIYKRDRLGQAEWNIGRGNAFA
jgi:hypothetical protein